MSGVQASIPDDGIYSIEATAIGHVAIRFNGFVEARERAVLGGGAVMATLTRMCARGDRVQVAGGGDEVKIKLTRIAERLPGPTPGDLGNLIKDIQLRVAEDSEFLDNLKNA